MPGTLESSVFTTPSEASSHRFAPIALATAETMAEVTASRIPPGGPKLWPGSSVICADAGGFCDAPSSKGAGGPEPTKERRRQNAYKSIGIRLFCVRAGFLWRVMVMVEDVSQSVAEYPAELSLSLWPAR
jgi:hypothetical protein